MRVHWGCLSGTSALLLAFAAFQPAALAEPETDDAFPAVTVCPDGSFESGCSLEDMQAAIKLFDDRLTTATEQCFYDTEAQCVVTASGTLPTPGSDSLVVWQRMALRPLDGPATDMIVLAGLAPDTTPILLAAAQTEGYFGTPDRFDSLDDTDLIHVRGVGGGTGGGNADLLLQGGAEGWTQVDLSLWFDEVNARLPQGFELRKGVRFDFREMFASSPVWREDDGNCCATGGDVYIDFGIEAGALGVVWMSFDETVPKGNTLYIGGNEASARSDDPVEEEDAGPGAE